MSKQISLREFPKKRFRTTVGLSMDITYVADTFEASSGSCDKGITIWLRCETHVFATQCPQGHNSLFTPFRELCKCNHT